MSQYRRKDFEVMGMPANLILSLPSDESKNYIAAHENANTEEPKEG